MELNKVVYLDEQAVYDFLEIKQEGSKDAIKKTVTETGVGAGIKADVGSGWFSNVFGIKLSGGASGSKTNLVETQISSTLIGEFTKYIDSKKAKGLKVLDMPELSMEEDSAAYYRDLTPYLDVVTDVKELSTMNEEDKETFNGMDIKKFKGLLDDTSGYYQMLFTDENGDKGIVRFNINGLRNNYSLSDLVSMELKLYGIVVGHTDSLDLRMFPQEEKVEPVPETGDFSERRRIKEKNDSKINKGGKYEIIDIVFAGV